MSNLVFNGILAVVSLVGLILMEIEPAQALIISLLLGILFTLVDIYLELKRKD